MGTVDREPGCWSPRGGRFLLPPVAPVVAVSQDLREVEQICRCRSDADRLYLPLLIMVIRLISVQ